MSEKQTPDAFPIMSCTLMDNVPWAFIAPHEKQAKSNHYQTLKRLAERGGLSVCEALAVVEGRDWRRMPDKEDAARQLINKVREWRAALAKTTGATQ